MTAAEAPPGAAAAAPAGAPVGGVADDAAGPEPGLCIVPDEAGGRGILGFGRALVAIAQAEGIGALYAGASTRALYIAALSSIQFFGYESLKQVLGVSKGELLVFFDVLSGLEVG